MEAADLSAAGREQGKDDVDAAGRLTYEIFSLLESKFLFGCDIPAGLFPTAAGHPRYAPASTGKVCVLSIDGGARAADGILAGAALVRLERFARELAKEHARRKQQQQLSLGGHPRPGDVPPVVVASAAAPNSNDKEQPTPKATASATASTVAPAEQAPPRRRPQAAAPAKKHAPATLRPDGGRQLVRGGAR